MAQIFEYFDLSSHLLYPTSTLDIILLSFIFLMLIIFTATSMLVKSCLATDVNNKYISLSQTLQSQQFCLKCSALSCSFPTSNYDSIINIDLYNLLYYAMSKYLTKKPNIRLSVAITDMSCPQPFFILFQSFSILFCQTFHQKFHPPKSFESYLRFQSHSYIHYGYLKGEILKAYSNLLLNDCQKFCFSKSQRMKKMRESKRFTNKKYVSHCLNSMIMGTTSQIKRNQQTNIQQSTASTHFIKIKYFIS